MNNPSDNQRVQEPMSEDTALLAAVLNTAIDAIVTIDEQGVILHANRALQKLFGYIPSDIVGKNVSVLMPEPDRSSHDGYLAKYKKTGRAAIIGIGRQVMGQRRDGSLIPIDLAVSEVWVGSRRLYTGIMRDMTERHQAESELRQTQLRLIQSERLAAIGQMMTGLAHESRNALQRSRACLDMLDLDLQSAPDQQDLIKRTRSALVELQVLYEEVRSYAAPIQLDRTLQCVQDMCEESWQNLVDQWQDRGIGLVLSCGECPMVSCDKQRICQVFRNIFENALAVIPDQTSIFVDCRVIQRDQLSFVHVSVADQGPGLDEEQRHRIFEPFYTTKTKGTGLGMAICHRIVDAHGGRIFVGKGNDNHAEMSGAVIVFELPVDHFQEPIGQ
jgi:two-component system, LuxR family, sensor kinase FixL